MNYGCCQKCYSNPCSCNSSCGCTSSYIVPLCPEFCTSLSVTNAWNVPACGQSAVLAIPGLRTVLIGSFLYNPTYGFFEITGFNSINYQVTVVNNCYVENAAPGTVVPANTKFIESAITGTGSTETWTPTVTGNGGMTVTGVTIDVAEQWAVGILEFFVLGIRFTLGGTASDIINVSMGTATEGFEVTGNTNFVCHAVNNSIVVADGAIWRPVPADPGRIIVVPANMGNWVLGTGGLISMQGFYRRPS